MFSIQKLFSKDDTFFDLLESSAEEARRSVQTLTQVLSSPSKPASIQEFHASKEADKRITEHISEALLETFVTQLEREDIEVLSGALYRVPKTVEKFVERFIICSTLVKDVDFSRHIVLLNQATAQLLAMVKLLRDLGQGRLDQ